MVQLKSFRYFDDQNNDSESPSQQTTSPSVIQQSRSSSTISFISGGNLTLTGANDSEDVSFNSAQSSQHENSKEDRSITLGSNEEYQIANHDIIAEEEDDDDEFNQLENNQSANPKPILQQAPARSQYVEQGTLIKSSSTPKSIHKLQNIRNPIGSPKVLNHSLSTHSLSRLEGPNQDYDSSPYTFIENTQQNNQFEIRWHNINLYATKSSFLPKYVTESSIYKMFSKQQPTKDPIPSSPMNLYSQNKLKSSNQISEKSMSKFNEPIITNNGETAPPVKTILNNVSGSVLSGQLTAILGPSGVGKTTLLNSLTGRNSLEGSGQVFLLGAGSGKKRMSVVTVPQTDVLPGKLTTLEDLQFTSRLKNPEKNFDHESNIERIVEHLQMRKFLNTRIDKLSGGEARRLSIGRELLSSPDIMILDEPTSGLDANTCKKIIIALRDIVTHSDNILGRPMAVIVTIHQPQQEVFNLFHRVYVMAKRGRSIYEGPPTSLLSSFLENSSINKVCQADQLNENPAIVAIEVASGEFGSKVIDELSLSHEAQMYEDYASSLAGTPMSTPRAGGKQMSPLSLGTTGFSHLRQHQRIKSPKLARSGDSISQGKPTPIMPIKRFIQQHQQFDQISSLTSLSYASSYDAELPDESSYLKVDKRLRRSVVMKSDFFSHTWTLMQRSWLLTTRDRFLMCIRIIGFIGVAIGIVQVYGNALDVNQNQCPIYETEIEDVGTFMLNIKNRLFNIQNQISQANGTHTFFFILLLSLTMVTSALAGLIFPFQMKMFTREYKNGWYSPGSFITSITFSELPIDFIGPTITILIAYPLCNQPESSYHWRECAYIMIVSLSSIVAKAQAQIISAFLVNSVENSVFMSCVLVTPPALLSGVVLRIIDMNRPLQILSYGSYLRYSLELLNLVRYGYDLCPCDPETVFGYPARTSKDAIPAHLNRLVKGFLELNSPENATSNVLGTLTNEVNQTSLEMSVGESEDDINGNLFVRLLRLVIGAGNLFPPNIQEIGDCSTYRSTHLLEIGVEDRILWKWSMILVLLYLIKRFIIYFVVKTVIKMQKGS